MKASNISRKKRDVHKVTDWIIAIMHCATTATATTTTEEEIKSNFPLVV